MKKHAVLFIAMVAVVVTMAITFCFLSVMNRIRANQADRQIVPPPASTFQINAPMSTSLKLEIAAADSVYENGGQIPEENLKNLVLANSRREIQVQCRSGVTYPELEDFLSKLKTFGIQNITLKIAN
jgi:biopolymer transport protein ExbD